MSEKLAQREGGKVKWSRAKYLVSSLSSMAEAANIASAIERVQSQQSEVEIIWESEGWVTSRASLSLISVLDSSFNPPTLAHLSLARFPPLDPRRSQLELEDGRRKTSTSGNLLLLSVRNVDKSLKKGDATYIQRIQMMILLAGEMVRGAVGPSTGDVTSDLRSTSAVAVGVIDEPTFVGKSTKLLRHLSSPSLAGFLPHDDTINNHRGQLQLTFVVGWDTLIRLFNPKYYGNSVESMRDSQETFFNKNGSSVVCSRRLQEGDPTVAREEMRFLSLEDVRPFVERGAIEMVDIGDSEASLSSTAVRKGISESQGMLTGTSKPVDVELFVLSRSCGVANRRSRDGNR